jgi:hypothetical protein
MKSSPDTIAVFVLIPILSLAMFSAQSASAQTAGPDSTQSDGNGPLFTGLWHDTQWHKEASNERMFFPHDMFWGWAQFDLAPPHNEIDPNLCSAEVAQNGGLNDPCSMFARYMLSSLVEFRPFGRGPLRRFMVFGAQAFLFGKNLPKTLYTWSPDAIGVEHSWGAGVYIGDGFEFRVTQHFLFDRLGARDKNLGSADFGPNGPWGRYFAVGMRKSFGTRRW